MNNRTIIKWVANFCFIVATISMLSPHIASTSIFPWVLYLIGNAVWGYDTYRDRNIPWVWLASFFVVWDMLLIVSRLAKIEILEYLQPIAILLERII